MGVADGWIQFAIAVVVLAAVTASYHLLDKRRGAHKTWIPHAIYWAIGILVIVLVSPLPFSKYIFSAITVTFVGCALPIYESVRAVCTPEEDDDKAWLQYWLIGGVLFLCTTWVDDVLGETGDVYWDEAMVFVFYWLYFPLTNGAELIYDYITEPYIAPLTKPMAVNLNNFINYLYNTLVNAAYLWLVWIFFLFLPKGLKRIVAVAIGTVYPLVSSIGAATTEEIEDDTYWLTYWSCYGVLFLLMDILETWLGWIPGFYSLIIFSTVYLMLPMFQGADKVFRKILVPLAGLQEMLMLRDAISIKKTMLKDLPPERAKQVRKAIAKFYDADDDHESADPAALKKELMTEYSGLTMSSLNPFGSSKKSEPTETTNLV